MPNREDTPKYVALLLTAPHDRNGNPRKVWVVLDHWGQTIGAWVTSYGATRDLPEGIRSEIGVVTHLGITLSAYRGWVREADRTPARVGA